MAKVTRNVRCKVGFCYCCYEHSLRSEYATGNMIEGSWFNCQLGQEGFLSSKVTRPVLQPTSYCSIFSREKGGRRVNLSNVAIYQASAAV
jgi:hypothetical protein